MTKEKTPNILDFVALGENLSIVCNPQVANVDVYAKAVGDFLRLLGMCGLPNTLAAAKPLDGIVIPHRLRPGVNITATAIHQLKILTESVSAALQRELNSKGIIFVDPGIPTKLLELQKELGQGQLQDHQQALLDDTIGCLRARLYRPAIVAAWNLGYDLVRCWVFRNSSRRNEFNQVLGKRTQNHHGGSRSIQAYADFFRENEGFVLEICRDAASSLSDFTTKTHRTNHFSYLRIYEGCSGLDRKACSRCSFASSRYFRASLGRRSNRSTKAKLTRIVPSTDR